MLLVAFSGCASNEEINVCVAEIESMQYLVNEPLKHLRSTLQSKEHLQNLKSPKECGDGSFGDICWLNRCLWW